MRTFNITSTFSKALGSQSVFRISVPQFRLISFASASMDEDVNRILAYWFINSRDDLNYAIRRWFSDSKNVDAEIREQFSPLVNAARASQLTSWTKKPQSTLALLILLDQFSRNIYRGTPDSYSADKLAQRVTTAAIAKGFDRQVEIVQQPFFYMPLMHSEELLAQVACLAHFELWEQRNTAEDRKMFYDFARKHLYCIERFGRFPSRNEVLGRESTEEELKHLVEYPGGF